MGSIHEVLRIERSVVLRAPRAKVWRALTEPTQFAAWFNVTMRGEFEPGGRVEMVTKYPGYEHTSFPLYVQKKEPEHLFSWRWYPGLAVAEEANPEQLSDVVFTLEEVQDGTRLTVTESGFERVSLDKRAKAFEGNDQGWAKQLENIEVYVGHAA